MTQRRLDEVIIERQRRGGCEQWLIYIFMLALLFGAIFGCCVSKQLGGPAGGNYSSR